MNLVFVVHDKEFIHIRMLDSSRYNAEFVAERWRLNTEDETSNSIAAAFIGEWVFERV